MNLNKKGYMLVEIILASALAFTVAYFLLNLTYKFKNIDEETYTSINYESTKYLITKNIMNDIERGNLSNFYYDESNNILDFKITIPTRINNRIDNIVENRRLKVTNDTITYGKTSSYKSDNYEIKDISYYQKKLPNNLKINKIEFSNNEDDAFGLFKIQVESLYDDNNYDIKILLTKHNNLDEAAGNCITININNDGGTSELSQIYYSYDNKKIYNNSFCTGSVLTRISKIPIKTIESTYTISFNTDGGNQINPITELSVPFDGYSYEGTKWIDGNGNIIIDTNTINITSDITLTADWNTTSSFITLPFALKTKNACEGWYNEEELTNKIGECGNKYILSDLNENKTIYIKWIENAIYKLNSPNTYAKTLQDAIAIINDKGTITMEDDDTIQSNNVSTDPNKTITINLNNKTLSLGDNKLINNSNTTIENGTMINTGTNDMIQISKGKTVLQGLTINTAANGITLSGSGSSLNIKGGTYTNTKNNNNYYFINNKNGSVVIKGGTFTFRNNNIIKNQSGNINIDKGNFITDTGTILENLGTTNIYTAKFEGCTNTLISNGTSEKRIGILTIRDGTFKIRNNCSAPQILINYSDKRKSNCSVNIYGGTFWQGGDRYGLVNRDTSNSGYGINTMSGTSLKAYATSNYVFYAKSGKIRLYGGTIYSPISKFYGNSSSSTTIDTGTRLITKQSSLTEPK